jgi:hypothetical protein
MKIKNIIGVILLLVLFAALTLGGVCMAFPFTPGTIMACWIFIAIVCAISGGFRRGERVGRLMFWTLAPIVAALVVSGIISSTQESATQQVASSVVAAIGQYEVTNGAPPTSLDRLVPAYFHSVPTTRFGLGGEQFYYHSRSNGFLLSYGLPYMMSRSYDSDTHTWKTKD